MFSTLSLVTSIKDYVEVVHKLIESDSNYNIQSYNDLGAIVSYIVLTGKQFFLNFVSLRWLQQIPTFPYLVPDIASAMISEISVLDGTFHNALTLVEKPISYGDQNLFFYSLEKFSIGFINSLVVFLPTSTASLITLRRFVVQGVEAGYLSGLGTLLGSLIWIASYQFGWRFLVLPWLSLDVLRHSIGLILLVKYMWDTYTERRMVLEDLSKWKIILLTFLLAFTEQTSLFPFLGNISLGSDASILESFPSTHISAFFLVHGSYILGLGLGGFSLLQLTCWFWENPAFRLYTWALSAVKIQTRVNLKFLNFLFLYLTMISAMSNLVYFGLDYTLTKPFGLVPNDRLIDQKMMLETSFLGTKASDRNTRMNMGRRGRRERWKKSVQRYRNFDASLYGDGIYDLFTMEDLNYGFDRFWLRRKMRNHDVPFRLFPGPWVRSFKKQLSRPRLESFSGPRFEFFRILFEQVYHPVFHEKKPQIKSNVILNQNFQLKNKNDETENTKKVLDTSKNLSFSRWSKSVLENFSFSPWSKLRSKTEKPKTPILSFPLSPSVDKERNFQKQGLDYEFSVLQKFIRKAQKRIQTSKIAFELKNGSQKISENPDLEKQVFSPIYSKRWKVLFSNWKHRADSNSLKKTNHGLRKALLFEKNVDSKLNSLEKTSQNLSLDQNQFSPSSLILEGDNSKNRKQSLSSEDKNSSKKFHLSNQEFQSLNFDSSIEQKWDLGATKINEKKDFENLLSKKDRQILKYKSFISQMQNKNSLSPVHQRWKKGEEEAKAPSFSQRVASQTKTVTSSKGNSLENVNSVSSSQSTFKPMTLFHPIKFYLHKEKAFKRKLKFYGATLFRNFGISNNSPYFRIMMKKFFYYYKPTLRWERTMRVATLKKIRRKGPRQPLRLNLSSWLPEKLGEKSLLPNTTSPITNSNFQNEFIQDDKVHHNFGGLQKPTHMYSLIGKRASRYRYQIYKDVLQHWYYSPFNRFLLKLDIDAFIRRQPAAHFLTANEEYLLQLRRALLLEHYETLRWYTYMQHYRSMKAHIGGTKSFASRFYNQQFQGTFKKIRHLFAVTPILNQKRAKDSGAPSSYLKWDQPLYHEYPNNARFSILNDSLLHEELLTELPLVSGENFQNLDQNSKKIEPLSKLNIETLPNSLNLTNSNEAFKSSYLPENLVEESQRIMGTYLIQARPIRQKIISQYLQEKNYWELTRFLFKGQKLRGTVPVTNSSAFLNQEKEYLYTNQELEDLREQTRKELKHWILEGKVKQNLWMSFIKKSQTTVYDRKSLKNYLKNKVETEESRKKMRQKQLKDRFDRIKNWLIVKSNGTKGAVSTDVKNERLELSQKFSESKSYLNQFDKRSPVLNSLSTGVRKAIKEGLQMQENLEERSLFKLPIINNVSTKFKRPLWKDPIKKSVIESKTNSYFLRHGFKKKNQILKQNLKNSLLNIENLIEKNQNLSSKTFFNIRRLSKKILFLVFPMFGSNNRSKQSKVNNLVALDSTGSNLLASYGGIDESSKEKQERKKTFLKKIPILMRTLFMNPANRTKSMKAWKQKQHVLVKRKQTRKVLKQLKKQINRVNSNFDDMIQNFKSVETLPLHPFFPTEKKESKQSANLGINRQKKDSSDIENLANSGFFQFLQRKEPWNVLNFTKDFQTKRSRKRGARPIRNRGAIKKPTLNDKLKRQFKLSKRYGKKMDNQKIELQILREESGNEFLKNSTKQRRTRQRENRFWRQHKKQKYSKNRRQMKKRKRFSVGKIRNLKRELKRVKTQVQIRQWWWQSFLPDFRANIDQILQNSKDRNIQEKFQSLSSSEILSRDLNSSNNFEELLTNREAALSNSLQIGDYDYKPLGLPQTLWIRNQLKQVAKNSTEILKNKEDSFSNPFNGETDMVSPKKFISKNIAENLSTNFSNLENPASHDVLNSSLFLTASSKETTLASSTNLPKKLMKTFNPIPFYAGWDEGLRKFIVTNRLLSRRDSGYQIPLTDQKRNSSSSMFKNSYSSFNGENEKDISDQSFSLYPLKGINVATTLYWQVPFTTYDPDQFFALGRDGFAPIGWRRFEFPSAKQTIKPIIVQTKTVTSSNTLFSNNANKTTHFSSSQNKLVENLQEKLLMKNSVGVNNALQKQEGFIQFSQKRNKRIKRHPRSPVSFPSGPLIHQVLPVHYIYIFYKRDRLPRDRYISRRLRRAKEGPSFAMQESLFKSIDWTLRKRVKPRRRYHRTRRDSSSQFGVPKNILRRQFREKPFPTSINRTRQRPMSKPKLATGQQLEDRLKERYQQRKRNSTLKLKGENLRIRQLRRRVQRQVFRPVWRYQPHPGGFVWPGDYLRLEFMKAPRLKETLNTNLSEKLTLQIVSSKSGMLLPPSGEKKDSSTEPINQEIRRKAPKKKKRTLQTWQIQPKKYLIQKHNRKVLKKRLQKAQNHHKFHQKLKELQSLVS